MSVRAFPYDVVEEYVKGGCSVIYKIRPAGGGGFDGKQYVLKCMLPDDDDPSSEQRFYMEYEFLRAYPHPNLVEVRDYFAEYNGNPAYVMEWVEGKTWQGYWQERDVLEFKREFLDHVHQLCEVLDFIHRHHIVHRDLKPQNILINSDSQIKLIDFGIMKVENLTLYTNRNTFMGSAFYVAPECLSGDEVNHAADIFSLGVMIYDMVTGTKPFRGHTLAETVYQRLVTRPKPPSQLRDLPEEIDPFMERLLHKEPHQRHQSGAEVYRELERIMGAVEAPSESATTLIDQISQEAFFHGQFLDYCREELAKNPVLLIHGAQGMGKTTLTENLAHKTAPDAVIKINCTDNISQDDLIELTIKNISLPSKGDPEIRPWINILGNVLPQLGWKVPNHAQQIHESSVISAFLNLMRSSQHPFVLLLDDIDLAPTAFHRFLKNLMSQVASQSERMIHIILTATDPIDGFEDQATQLGMNFPDVLTISDYFASKFGECRVPLELVMRIIEESHDNISEFLRLVPEIESNGTLFVKDGVLCLLDTNSLETKPKPRQSSIPEELGQFTSEQLVHLEWVALAPSGLDLRILQKVTGADLETLGVTLKRADQLGLLDYSSSGMEGFRWKRTEVRDFLVDSYSANDRRRRYKELSMIMEKESAAFLAYSPPLWLVLSQLYSEAGNDEKATAYAIDYARYCLQNANYEPIRNLLNPFVSYASLQSNQEFWSMLAFAHRAVDPEQALMFAKRALDIDHNIQSISLNAIIEYDLEHVDRVDALISDAYTKHGIEAIDVNSATNLIPILVSLGYQERADRLVKLLEDQLSSRNDLFANNLVVLAQTQRLQSHPSQLVAFWQDRKIELLPQNETATAMMRFEAHIHMFQLGKAHDSMSAFADSHLDAKTRETQRFRQSLYLYLNFLRFDEIRRLIARLNSSKQTHLHLATLNPLVQLMTEFVLRDQKIYQVDHIMAHLGPVQWRKKQWLSSLLAAMDPRTLDSENFERIFDILTITPPPSVRLQIPRLRVLSAFYDSPEPLDGVFREATEFAANNKLNMELMRLDALRTVLLDTQRISGGTQSAPVEISDSSEGNLFKQMMAQLLS